MLACWTGAVGFYILGGFLENAQPQGWDYWLVENQTYRYTRSKALPYLWLPGISAAWLLVLGGIWATRLLARTRQPRNNPPPEQE
jgi:hypothetical protein